MPRGPFSAPRKRTDALHVVRSARNRRLASLGHVSELARGNCQPCAAPYPNGTPLLAFRVIAPASPAAADCRFLWPNHRLLRGRPHVVSVHTCCPTALPAHGGRVHLRL